MLFVAVRIFCKKSLGVLCGVGFGSLSLQPQTGEDKKGDNTGSAQAGFEILKSSLTEGKRKVLKRPSKMGEMKSLSQKRSLVRRKNERPFLRERPKDYTMESLILAQDER